MKKNLFLTFCFSFIPGAGQMYQNYMKRGLSFMVLFAASIAASAITQVSLFAIPIPIIMAYSFFDTYHIRNKKEDDIEPRDEYVWNTTLFKNVEKEIKLDKKNPVIGFVLIILGLYLFFNFVLRELAYQLDLDILYRTISLVVRYVPTIIISVLSIYFGVKFISKK